MVYTPGKKYYGRGDILNKKIKKEEGELKGLDFNQDFFVVFFN